MRTQKSWKSSWWEDVESVPVGEVVMVPRRSMADVLQEIAGKDDAPSSQICTAAAMKQAIDACLQKQCTTRTSTDIATPILFVFTSLNPEELNEQYLQPLLPTQRKSLVPGSTTPHDILIHIGNTGCEPTCTGLFHRANVTTKICNGSIEVRPSSNKWYDSTPFTIASKGDPVPQHVCKLVELLRIPITDKPRLLGSWDRGSRLWTTEQEHNVDWQIVFDEAVELFAELCAGTGLLEEFSTPFAQKRLCLFQEEERVAKWRSTYVCPEGSSDDDMDMGFF